MSFRRTGVLLLLALTAGCGAAPQPTASAPPPSPTRTPPVAEPHAPAPPPSEEAPAPVTRPADSQPEKDKKGDARGPDDKQAVTGATVVAGSLGGNISQAEVRQVIMKYDALFDACYKLGAAGSTQYVATVTVKATIGPTGKVNAAEVIKSTSRKKPVDICVTDAFKKMEFPAPKGGVTSVITFPIEFAGVEEVLQ